MTKYELLSGVVLMLWIVSLADEPPTAPAGYYAAPIGYAPNAEGYYRVYTIAPLPPAPPRNFDALLNACILED